MRLGYLAAQQGQPIMVANDDMEWNQHLLHSTAEGWRMFWSSLAGDTDTNLVGNPSEVDTAVHDIFHGLTQNVNNESSLRLVDMRCLTSTVGIQNCFVEKQSIRSRPAKHIWLAVAPPAMIRPCKENKHGHRQESRRAA